LLKALAFVRLFQRIYHCCQGRCCH